MDSWRHRHDDFQQHLMAEAAVSSFDMESELYYRFSDLLPATLIDQGGELQFGRKRQGVVPDFGFFEDTPEGPVPRLAELKFISAGKSIYPPGESKKGTERRADKLTAEYEKKLWDLDVRLHETLARDLRCQEPEPAPGPLIQRFRCYGSLCQGKLVAGAWGDLSSDLHSLLCKFAESRVKAAARARGWEEEPGDLGKVMGEIRRA